MYLVAVTFFFRKNIWRLQTCHIKDLPKKPTVMIFIVLNSNSGGNFIFS